MHDYEREEIMEYETVINFDNFRSFSSILLIERNLLDQLLLQVLIIMDMTMKMENTSMKPTIILHIDMKSLKNLERDHLELCSDVSTITRKNLLLSKSLETEKDFTSKD